MILKYTYNFQQPRPPILVLLWKIFNNKKNAFSDWCKGIFQ